MIVIRCPEKVAALQAALQDVLAGLTPEERAANREIADLELMAEAAMAVHELRRDFLEGYGLREFGPWLARRDGGWFCRYCGIDVSAEWEIDHVWPRSRADEYSGCVHEPRNLVLACRACNRAKAARILRPRPMEKGERDEL